MKTCTKRREEKPLQRARSLSLKRAASVEWRKKNPERNRVSSARWARENPEAVTAKMAAFLARKWGALGSGMTTAQWKQILADSLGLCAYCNKRAKLSVDHIEPLSRGGEHGPENIVAACMECNRSKNDTPLLAWLAAA